MCPKVLLFVLTTASSAVANVMSDDESSFAARTWFSDLVSDRYRADDGSISYESLKGMMDDYGVGTGTEELYTLPVVSDTNNNIDYWQCYNQDSLLSLYGASEGGSLNISDLCPMFLQQMQCSDKSQEFIFSSQTPPRTTDQIESYEAWLYATVFIFLISLCSLAGVIVMPFMKKEVFKHILVFLVGLAVGSLVGSAVFQLIPACLDVNMETNHTYAWRTTSIIAGIIVFFNTERVMKLIMGRKNTHSHGHSHVNRHDDIVETGINKREPFESETTSVDILDEPVKYSELSNGDSKLMNGCGTNVVNHKPRIAPVAWMIIFGDGVHNFVDGLAIGAAFTTSKMAGISMSLACICEELPHELGDFGILLNSGMSMKQAIVFNFLSACTAFLGMIVGILLGENTEASVWIFGFAGGMFLYIALVDMVPEMNHADQTDSKPSLLTFILQNAGLSIGYLIMFSLAMFGGHIEV